MNNKEFMEFSLLDLNSMRERTWELVTNMLGEDLPDESNFNHVARLIHDADSLMAVARRLLMDAAAEASENDE